MENNAFMDIHKLVPRATKEQFATTRNKFMQLETYKTRTIIKLGICKVKLENKNKKICNFFAVPGNGQALLGMPDIKTLDI